MDPSVDVCINVMSVCVRVSLHMTNIYGNEVGLSEQVVFFSSDTSKKKALKNLNLHPPDQRGFRGR